MLRFRELEETGWLGGSYGQAAESGRQGLVWALQPIFTAGPGVSVRPGDVPGNAAPFARNSPCG
jgi:hypothetical protein